MTYSSTRTPDTNKSRVKASVIAVPIELRKQPWLPTPEKVSLILSALAAVPLLSLLRMFL